MHVGTKELSPPSPDAPDYVVSGATNKTELPIKVPEKVAEEKSPPVEPIPDAIESGTKNKAKPPNKAQE
jgi:hypothetical protein